MLNSMGAVVGSYLLSVIILVMATDPLLSHAPPGRFRQRPRRPLQPCATSASTTLFVIVSISLRLDLRPLCPCAVPGGMCSASFVLGEAMGIGATILNWSKPWPHCVLAVTAAHVAGELLDRPLRSAGAGPISLRADPVRSLPSLTGSFISLKFLSDVMLNAAIVAHTLGSGGRMREII